jgi:HlyD family secretion protein
MDKRVAGEEANVIGALRAVRPADAAVGEPQRRRVWQLRRWLWTGAAVVIVLAAVLGYGYWLSQRGSAMRYVTAPVTRGAVIRSASASGTVNPFLTIIVGAYVSGVIQNIYCDYNTVVKKGQLCAQIDPRPYKAALSQAEGQLARDQAQLEGARINLERYRTLLKQNSIARQTFEDQAALVHQLEGTVKLDQGVVETARVNLDYTNIISPVKGTVVSRNVTIGQTVAASFQTPTLFLIATDLTSMEVDTNVTESDIGGIKDGENASFTVESFPDRPFDAKVLQLRQAPQTVQNVVTYDVVIGFDNKELLLKPGMTATVRIITARRDDVLRVPDQSVRFTPGGIASITSSGAQAPQSGKPQVWVLRDGHPERVVLKLGLDDETNSEFLEGDLKLGDKVIIGEQRSGQSAPGPFRFGL